jgi:CHAD domain-containing protein
MARTSQARRGSKRKHAFRLVKDEPVPDGIRRIARTQLEEVFDQVRSIPKGNVDDGVHEARKAFKRLRATVRLSRGAIGDATYKRENVAFRDAGRRLSDVRDASVLVETVEDLEKRDADLNGAMANLCERLEGERKQAIESLEGNKAVVAAVIADTEKAQLRTATWEFETDGFDALEPGLRRIYRRGRKAMQRAEEDPSDENLHQWRKRVKDLWHAEQILEPASPKKLKKLAKRTHAVADLLGDDHDLAELRLYVVSHRIGFDEGAEQAALLTAIDTRREKLQRKAFRAGSKLYKRRPRRFVEKVASLERKA